jgi:hypothetical protein
MIDYRKLYSELSGPGAVSPEMVYAARSAEQSGAFRSKHPEIFDADHPLAFSDAQNTAQKAKDKSDELQEAFKAASAGDFEKLSERDKEIMKLPGGFEQNLAYSPSALGVNNPLAQRFKPKMGEYAPNRRIFAGSYYETDPYGHLKNEAYNWAKTGVQFAGGSHGSIGFDQGEKGAKKSNLPTPFIGEGNLPSPYETFHSIGKVEGPSVKDYLSARDINPIRETPKPEGFNIPDKYKGLMAPPQTQ